MQYEFQAPLIWITVSVSQIQQNSQHKYIQPNAIHIPIRCAAFRLSVYPLDIDINDAAVCSIYFIFPLFHFPRYLAHPDPMNERNMHFYKLNSKGIHMALQINSQAFNSVEFHLKREWKIYASNVLM